jgi:CheY-like chemotaxis protein
MVATEDKPRVLVVDDEQLIADTLALILNRSGFSATAAYSGEEAVEVASVLNPDILISDVIMFEMTGIDLAIHVVKSVPGCRVLLLSGQAATADLLRSAEQRGHSFEIIAKPVHPRALLELLQRKS